MSKKNISGSAANEPGNSRPDFLSAALAAFAAGFTPAPIEPGTKRTTRRWALWRKKLTKRTIRQYWKKYPDHEVGILLDDSLIVYDADTPEGVAALRHLEESLALKPNLIVGTKRGEHHYYIKAPGTAAKSFAPDKVLHPERFDSKTGKALIIIPPSTGKYVILNEITTVEDLVEINQGQIDTIDKHNGRSGSTESSPRPAPIVPAFGSSDAISELKSLLDHLDPDKGYSKWLDVLMAIFHSSQGSVEGLALATEWSRAGCKYDGPEEIAAKWETFDLDHDKPVTVATLYRMVKEHLGEARYLEIYPTLGPQWDLSSGGDSTVSPGTPGHVNPLLAFSLQGQSAQLKTEFANQMLILGMIAIRGQWMVLFAPPNAGKTLIIIFLIIQAIKKKVIDPQHLFYINADDGGSGLATKAGIADKYGFHMLAPGHKGFHAKDLIPMLKEVSDNGLAANVIIILDTLKKFTDTMSKPEQTRFGIAIREFNAKGGTVIMLAHTNKNPDKNGNLVPAGTSDIRDDADCAYIITPLSDQNNVRTVDFENIKRRGDVTKIAAYQYSTADGLSYKKLLESVVEVDPQALDQLHTDITTEANGDNILIELVKGYIVQGINTKTALVKELAEQDGVSKSRATKLIEGYTGTDPIKHRWRVKKQKHNKFVFSILTATSPDPAPAAEDPPEES